MTTNNTIRKEVNKSKLIWIISIAVIAIVALAFMVSTIVLAVGNNKPKKQNQYDFYITEGTLPTLYSTLQAYASENPNTYMWFQRGNTISYEYSAPFIHYLDGQSKNNSNSTYNILAWRKTVRTILLEDPTAKFRLFCDDIRARFILDIFIAAGVDFEALDVVLISDGTLTYQLYYNLREENYVDFPSRWKNYLELYTKNRNNPSYTAPGLPLTNTNYQEINEYAFYLPIFPNVSLWIQQPEYLVNTLSPTLQKTKFNLNIVQKAPKAMYDGLSEAAHSAYQRVVLANALIDNTDNLTTLDDAVKYFDSNLQKVDKEVVLILGSATITLDGNKTFIDQTLAFYTPTKDNTTGKILYKGKSYDSTDGTTISVDNRVLKIGELGVHLYYKGHPGFTLETDYQKYLEDNSIKILPKRTPIEVLIWMYNVKVGGYASTAYLSCYKTQVEFFYYLESQWTPALQLMGEQGFFDDTKFFQL